MAAVKGSAWLTLIEFIKQKGGIDAVEKIMAQLSPEDARILSRKILSISWLDYGVYTRFLLKADQMFGQGDHALIKESAIHHARKDMKGIYSMFMRIATPAFVLSRSPQLWRQIFDSGKLRVANQTPQGVELELTEMEGVPKHHELDQLPFMEEIARMTGAKNVKCTHPRCLARGDDHCLYVVAWDA